MRIKPILFNTDMVRAILDGKKTVTRRVVKGRALDNMVLDQSGNCVGSFDFFGSEVEYPTVDDCHYHFGDILWVRETWFYERHMEDLQEEKPDLPSGRYSFRYIYRADTPDYPVDVGVYAGGWRQSIFMPREAARIFLRVTDVHLERVQEITEDGARAEGCFANHREIAGGPWGIEDDPDEWTAREEFAEAWDSIIKPADRDKYGWAANPWVWCIGFERCERPEGWPL